MTHIPSWPGLPPSRWTLNTWTQQTDVVLDTRVRPDAIVDETSGVSEADESIALWVGGHQWRVSEDFFVPITDEKKKKLSFTVKTQQELIKLKESREEEWNHPPPCCLQVVLQLAQT